MRRYAVPFMAVALVLLGLMTVTGVRTVAQEATPVAGDDGMMTEGITFEVLGYGTAAALPTAPAELQLFRLRLEPGATFPFDPADPSTGMAFVEAGEVTFTVSSPMTVLRAAAAGVPFPEETEEFAAGTEFTLNLGDSAVFPPHVEGEARNDGSEQALLLVANVAPPMGQMMESEEDSAAATPAA